jgi:inner membrane transporter RhtA
LAKRISLGRGALAGTPAPLLIVVSSLSVQSSAALATALFDSTGPLGAVWLRTLFAALVLFALVPRVGRRGARGEVRWIVAGGLVIAAMNVCFYESIARIPLAVAVTVEFLGPLTVALVGSRRGRDFLWIAFAGAGIALLGSPRADVDRVGLALAFGAAVFWGASIFIGKRIAHTWPLAEGVTLPLAVGAIALAPVGITAAGTTLVDPVVLGIGIAVAVLGSVVPHLLGQITIRRVRASTFGIFMSLHPAVAALAGLAFLGQALDPVEIAAVLLVVAASIGANRSDRSPTSLAG